jgi:hypothetical protein
VAPGGRIAHHQPRRRRGQVGHVDHHNACSIAHIVSGALVAILLIVCPRAAQARHHVQGQSQTDSQNKTPAKTQLLGRPLIEVLRELQAQGLRLIFSSDLVSPNLRINIEPRGRSARAMLVEILAPHGLIVRDGPRNTLLIVRTSAARAPSRATAESAVTASAPLPATMPVDGLPVALIRIEERVEVPATSPIAPSAPTEVATRIHWKVTDTLPTTRTLAAAINLAPGVHDTGPNTNTTIAGAMSFENVIMLNGVQITDNLRGTPFNLFIEDAIEETTVKTAGISAEYGRFAGGVVNTITKSGGNDFGGSLRVTLNNDTWRTVSPFGEGKHDKTVPTYEYTFGGPVVRDRTWFFTAGRMQKNVTAQTTTAPASVPYEFTDEEQRVEAKLTHALAPGHTARFGYIGIRQAQKNYGFGQFLDTRSLIDRDLPQGLFSANYHGVLSPSLFIEGQYSRRHFTFQQAGGRNRDRIEGTQLIDQARGGLRYWAPSFCGVCGDEKRDNEDLLVKGTYFRSTRQGSHNVVFGFDSFTNRRFVDNHQSASDYRIVTTTSIVRGDEVFPVLSPDDTAYIIYSPILEPAKGSAFTTDSLFVNDTWRVSPRLAFNIGLRLDHNRVRNGAGLHVVSDSAFSPRLGAVWDLRGDGLLSLTASYARYIAPLADNIVESGSAGGHPAVFEWFYRGPSINADQSKPLMPTEEALKAVFDWFDGVGGTNLRPFRDAEIPGIGTRISPSLRSPYGDELSVGLSASLHDRGSVRVDYVRRSYGNFYVLRNDLSNGTVTDELGQEFDLTTVENTNLLSREYQGVQFSGNVNFWRIAAGGNYTLSRLHGTMTGETFAGGPFASGFLSAPEYFDPAWSYPQGDLSADERHRARVWATLTVPMREALGSLAVSAFESIDSGTPYGAVGAIDTRPYVDNPGYVTPPAQENYYFTPRDAFRTEMNVRTDLALNYTHHLAGRSNLFVNAHVLNVLNRFARWNVTSIDQTVQTRQSLPWLTGFNPFTTPPVFGRDWLYGPVFGTALDRNAYTVPRTFRFAVGLRF